MYKSGYTRARRDSRPANTIADACAYSHFYARPAYPYARADIYSDSKPDYASRCASGVCAFGDSQYSVCARTIADEYQRA